MGAEAGPDPRPRHTLPSRAPSAALGLPSAPASWPGLPSGHCPEDPGPPCQGAGLSGVLLASVRPIDGSRRPRTTKLAKEAAEPALSGRRNPPMSPETLGTPRPHLPGLHRQGAYLVFCPKQARRRALSSWVSKLHCGNSRTGVQATGPTWPVTRLLGPRAVGEPNAFHICTCTRANHPGSGAQALHLQRMPMLLVQGLRTEERGTGLVHPMEELGSLSSYSVFCMPFASFPCLSASSQTPE